MYWKDKLQKQPKEQLIERLSYLIQKTENQTKQLTEQQSAISKYRLKIKSLELKLSAIIPEVKKEKVKFNHYETLLLNYRLEISDLKDEIDSWKERYIACLKKGSKSK